MKHQKQSHRPRAGHKDGQNKGPRDHKPQEYKPKDTGGGMPRPSLYGFHAVREAWLNPERTIYTLYLTESARSGFEPVLAEARAKGLKRPDPTDIEKGKLERLLPQGAVHQGIALSAAHLEDVFIQDLMIRTEHKDRTVFLMLDQVTDPHNVGAILRSASAFGADGVIMQRKHAPELEGPTGAMLAKAACGAIEHIPVAFETNLSRTLEELKENGFFVYGLAEEGTSTIDALTAKPKPGEKIVLVLGSEGEGLRRLIKENCDALVRLPTQPPIGSLNVSNAAAVALYAVAKKN
jgi:23S rRNA (guanosine2251-2'-O)-methyltransferase